MTSVRVKQEQKILNALKKLCFLVFLQKKNLNHCIKKKGLKLLLLEKWHYTSEHIVIYCLSMCTVIYVIHASNVNIIIICMLTMPGYPGQFLSPVYKNKLVQ